MGIATKLEAAIDLMLNTYVSGVSSTLCSDLTPVAISGFTIYLLLMGFAVMRGQTQDSVQTIAWRCAKVGFICGLALSAGDYNNLAVGGIQGIQGVFTNAFGGVPSIGALIDNMSAPYDALGQSLYSQATTGFMPNFSLLLAAGMVAIAQAVLFVVGLGLYLLAKVTLALTFAIGPAFILCAMFPATQRFTESWLGQALNSVMLNVLIAASITMLTSFASQFAQAVQNNLGTSALVNDIMALLLVSGSLAVVMLNFNSIAGALAGGASISGIGRDIYRGVSDMLRRSPKPAEPAAAGGAINNTSGAGGGYRIPQYGTGAANSSPYSYGNSGAIPLYQRNVMDNIRKAAR
jgi:type IV secretion system protein VirB6